MHIYVHVVYYQYCLKAMFVYGSRKVPVGKCRPVIVLNSIVLPRCQYSAVAGSVAADVNRHQRASRV